MNRALVVMGLGVVAFAVALAIYVGNHLSNEALAVLTGAVCGAGAMLPAAMLGFVSLLRRREADRNEPPHPPVSQPQTQYPPVIVVAPPGQHNALPPSPAGWQGAYSQGYSMPAGSRQFNVIGDEEGESNNGRRDNW